jgi:hypothetical protein
MSRIKHWLIALLLVFTCSVSALASTAGRDSEGFSNGPDWRTTSRQNGGQHSSRREHRDGISNCNNWRITNLGSIPDFRQESMWLHSRRC